MKWLRGAFLVVVTLGVASVQTAALEVVLHNRKRFVGEVRLSRKTVFVHVGATTYKIPRGGVKAVRLFGAEQAEFVRRNALLGTSVEAHFMLGKWLEARFQYAAAEQYYKLTLTLDGEHEGAREALGYGRTDGKWTRTQEDVLRLHSRWLGPRGADACFELARLHRESGNEKRVEPMLRQALIAWPRHPDALKMMRPITDGYVSKNRYRLPVEGLWGVIHDYNDHHKKAAFMAYALDFMKVDEQFQVARVATPTGVQDYHTWGATIHAAADGEVYSVNDGFPDCPLGRWTDFRSANTVCIRHPHGEYTVYGHLQNHSIVVKKGQKVKAGDVIARGGNSGSSGWPHMHWAMYDRDGIGLPVTFSNFREVLRAGEKTVESGRAVENHFYRNSFGGKP